MSLYRQPGRVGRRALVVAVVVALVAGLAGGYLAGRAAAPDASLGDRLAAVRAAVRPAEQGIELSGTEYGQAVRGGRIVAPTEYAAARADVRRARAAVDGAEDDLRLLDPEGTATLMRALAALDRAVARKAAPVDIARLGRAAGRALAAITPRG